MGYVKTVLGNVPESELEITLAHEHICCYSEYLYAMAGKAYLDEEQLISTSVKYLKELKSAYGLKTFVDCTPVNLGRNVEWLKQISEQSEVHIICSTGFYHTEEVLMRDLDIDTIADYMVLDAVRAGLIKCAVEDEQIGCFHEKLLRASAGAQRRLKIPMAVHTNANNQNGRKALEILLQEGVDPKAITIGHLSDTDDMAYIKQIAELGCFIGFDRLYGDCSKDYISKTVSKIVELCDCGYGDQILLSHDALFFNGFDAVPQVNERPRFSYCFDHILPALPTDLFKQIMEKNPVRMLKCGE